MVRPVKYNLTPLAKQHWPLGPNQTPTDLIAKLRRAYNRLPDDQKLPDHLAFYVYPSNSTTITTDSWRPSVDLTPLAPALLAGEPQYVFNNRRQLERLRTWFYRHHPEKKLRIDYQSNALSRARRDRGHPTKIWVENR